MHGGHVDKGDDLAVGFDNWRKTFAYAEKEGGFPLPILIENTAGGDNACARRFDDLARLWDAVGEFGAGFCLDTCHAHAGGEDLLGIVDRVKAITGRIDLIHANDSKDGFDSGRDRHDNLGNGKIDPELMVAVDPRRRAPRRSWRRRAGWRVRPPTSRCCGSGRAADASLTRERHDDRAAAGRRRSRSARGRHTRSRRSRAPGPGTTGATAPAAEPTKSAPLTGPGNSPRRGTAGFRSWREVSAPARAAERSEPAPGDKTGMPEPAAERPEPAPGDKTGMPEPAAERSGTRAGKKAGTSAAAVEPARSTPPDESTTPDHSTSPAEAAQAAGSSAGGAAVPQRVRRWAGLRRGRRCQDRTRGHRNPAARARYPRARRLRLGLPPRRGPRRPTSNFPQTARRPTRPPQTRPGDQPGRRPEAARQPPKQSTLKTTAGKTPARGDQDLSRAASDETKTGAPRRSSPRPRATKTGETPSEKAKTDEVKASEAKTDEDQDRRDARPGAERGERPSEKAKTGKTPRRTRPRASKSRLGPGRPSRRAPTRRDGNQTAGRTKTPVQPRRKPRPALTVRRRAEAW